MRIAAIDCGTNSLHLVIAQMDDGGRYDVLHDLKEMPRLGEGVVQRGELSEAAMVRALQTLGEFAHICRRFAVDKVRAVATSAVRRARNGSEFLVKVRTETGIPLEVISGEEEARLVSAAVLAEPGFTDGRFMLFNVGGGSTEFAWGRARVIKEMVTLPIGAVTLTEEFLKSDPPRGSEIRALQHAIAKLLKDEVPGGDGRAFTLYGTGGTVSTLVAIYQVLRFGTHFGAVFYPMSYGDTGELFLTLAEKDLKQRQELPGLKNARAEIIVGGAAVVKGIMDHGGRCGMMASAHGLKYGILADESRELKGRLLIHLLGKSGEVAQTPEVVHAQHVRHLSEVLFDCTASLHRYGAEEREILGVAALLHDIGQSIEYRRHHKHSYTLINGADLGRLNGPRKELVAQIARYHRKAVPTMKHRPFSLLARDDRDRVRTLSAILRVADGLDRSHSQAVTGVRCEIGPARIALRLQSTRISTLDQLGANSRKSFMELVFSRAVEIVPEREESLELSE